MKRGRTDPKREEGDELGKTEVGLKVSKQALKEQPPLFLFFISAALIEFTTRTKQTNHPSHNTTVHINPELAPLKKATANIIASLFGFESSNTLCLISHAINQSINEWHLYTAKPDDSMEMGDKDPRK